MSSERLELDADQLRAVRLAPGTRRVVLGGPGTGKSAVAIELVARHLEQGGDISRVVVLTSSRSSAAVMRDRLARRTGRTSAGPLARSVASLAHAIVTRDSMVRHRRPPVLLSGGDEDAAWRRFLSADAASADGIRWPDHLDQNVRALPEFRAELRELIARLTERGETHASFAERAHSSEAHREIWVAAAEAWRRFEHDLASGPGEVPVMTLSTIVRSAAAIMRGQLMPEYDLVVVDDAQELTAGALDLVMSLSGAEQPSDLRQRSAASIVLLGSTDTSAGVFRGAQPGLLTSESVHLYERVLLGRQHRFGGRLAELCKSTAQLVGVAGDPRERTYDAPDDSSAAVSVRVAEPAGQGRLIADVLRQRHLIEGVPWSEMAVVVRSSGIARQIAEELAGLEVPVSRAGTLQWRSSGAVRPLASILAAASGAHTMTIDVLHEILSSPYFSVDALQWRRLRRALRAALAHSGARVNVDEWLLQALESPERLDSLREGVQPGPMTQRVLDSLTRLADALRVTADLADGPPGPALWRLWKQLDVADDWYRTATGSGAESDLVNEHLDAVMGLFRQADVFSERFPERIVRDFADEWLETGVDDDSIVAPAQHDAVTVGTPASFISREFDSVVVAGADEGVWPNLRLRSSLLRGDEFIRGASDRTEVLHDEARLFSLAVSRARSSLLIVSEESERERPSRFIADLALDDAPERMPMSLRAIIAQQRSLLAASSADEAERDRAASVLRYLGEHGVPGADPSTWYGMQELSTDAPMRADGETPRISPSKIEQFDDCEVAWVVNEVAGESVGNARSIGTIVHDAVEHATSFTAGELLDHVDGRWPSLEFETPWEGASEHAAIEHIVERLEAYFDMIAAEGYRIDPGLREARLHVDLAGATLTGSIDWVERGADGIRIVDLKTGRTQVTKDAAKEHPQLLAYQLAVSRGGVPGVEPGTEVTGARLVYPRSTAVNASSMVREQPPLGGSRLDAFAAAVVEAAQRMAGASFTTVPEQHCLKNSGFVPECRIQVTKQVTE